MRSIYNAYLVVCMCEINRAALHSDLVYLALILTTLFSVLRAYTFFTLLCLISC